jgi:hypothetical protein
MKRAEEDDEQNSSRKESDLEDLSVSSSPLTFSPEILDVSFDPGTPMSGRRCVPVVVGVEIEPEVLVDLEYQEPRHAQNRAAFISVTVVKDSQEARLGIALREVDGTLEIFSISDGGLLSDSPLEAGDRLLSINNFRCGIWDPHKAIQRLKDITGTLTIIAENKQGDPNLVASMVSKRTLDTTVGIGFMKVNHTLSVGSINPDGLFANSVLNIGDRILSINNAACSHLEPENAVLVVQNADSHVTFVALREYKRGVVVSRHSFRSTCSSARSYQSRLASAIDHGTDRPIPFFVFIVALASLAIGFFVVGHFEKQAGLA